MVKYVCKLCNKIFSQKSNYSYHINRKNPCVKLESQKNHLESQKNHLESQKTIEKTKEDHIIVKINDHYNCNYCNKEFTTNSNYNRHINKYCKVKKNKDGKMEELYQELIVQMKLQNNEMKLQNNEMKLQKQKINELEFVLKKTKIVNNNKNTNNIKNTNTNTNSHNTQNITLLAFGKEDYSFITNNELKQILNKGHQSIPELIKHVYFNNKKPQNSNIYISNIKDQYVMVYNGHKWELNKKDKPINDLLENNADYLEDKFYKLIENLDSRTKNRFERFINKRDEDETRNKIKEDIKLILYNHKDIPMKMIKVSKSSGLLNENYELM